MGVRFYPPTPPRVPNSTHEVFLPSRALLIKVTATFKRNWQGLDLIADLISI